MDPILTPIMIVLGKYVMDKGVELAKEVGPKALDTAKEIYTITLDHLRQNPKTEVIVEEFEQDPVASEKLLEKKLADALATDPDLAGRLKTLLAQYDQAAQEHSAQAGASYQATLTGSGAIAQGPGAVAAGAGSGVAVGGNVEGGINIGRPPQDDDDDDDDDAG